MEQRDDQFCSVLIVFCFPSCRINGILLSRFTGMPKTTVFRVVQALKAEEAEDEKEYAVLRESDLADRFLYDEIVW